MKYLSIDNLSVHDYTEETLNRLTIKLLKQIIKKKNIIKFKLCNNRQDYIDCILYSIK